MASWSPEVTILFVALCIGFYIGDDTVLIYLTGQLEERERDTADVRLVSPKTNVSVTNLSKAFLSVTFLISCSFVGVPAKLLS